MALVLLYHAAKFYFTVIMPVLYVYALVTGDVNLFFHISGIVAILFLISNILWYSGKGR